MTQNKTAFRMLQTITDNLYEAKHIFLSYKCSTYTTVKVGPHHTHFNTSVSSQTNKFKALSQTSQPHPQHTSFNLFLNLPTGGETLIQQSQRGCFPVSCLHNPSIAPFSAYKPTHSPQFL